MLEPVHEYNDIDASPRTTTTYFCASICSQVWYFPQDRKIEELQQSLMRSTKVQDMVMTMQEKKGER